ncbi:MAG: CHAT domain-containing protein [Cyanobacteria bacterium P01_A01_bin.84]
MISILKLDKKRNKTTKKKIIDFIILTVISAVFCITSPGFAQIPIIAKAPASHSQNRSAASLEKQGRSLYEKSQFSEAATVFEQAAIAYQKSQNPIRQALSLSNLSLCYQQLGRWDEANSNITEAIKLLNSISDQTSAKPLALAQTLDIQGSLQLARGENNAALESWKSATDIYVQQNKPARKLVSQINQAQALQNLGLYRRAISLLETSLNLPPDSTDKPKKLTNLLKNISASPETTTALYTLGDSLRVIGNLKSARIVLEHNLKIAEELELRDRVALTQLSLGNTLRTQLSLANEKKDKSETSPQTTPQSVINLYQQAAAKSTSSNIRLQAQLNQLSLLTSKGINTNTDKNKNKNNITQKNLDSSIKLLAIIEQEITALPPSRSSIEARLNLAETMMQIRDENSSAISQKSIAQNLAIAIEQAKKLNNPRLLSYAWGNLGKVYEKNQQWAEAQKLTEKALKLAEQTKASDIAYIWQWQLGRVTKAQNQIEPAITAYQEAIATIKSLRTDLASANPDLQFSFTNSVEPIHRELVSLLLQSKKQDNLEKARDIIEGLQLVELDNFFRQACLNANPAEIDNVDNKAAVIYPIILKDQLAIITSLPKFPQQNKQEKKVAEKESKREFHYYKTVVSNQEVEQLTSTLLPDLKQETASKLAIPQLQKMYDLLIKPTAEDLEKSQIETLVFVLDGVLRNIPVSALYDGKQYLVEKYSIALTPGLQLLSPRSLTKESLGALVGGLSEARDIFPELPHVKNEVTKIQSELPTQVLFNENFKTNSFQNKVSNVSYPIVHLATHGQFSSKADETFILTWDGKINVNQLSSTLKTVELSQDNSLELLVLSACETAAGDERSALGLAGVAVRSGARSTVATLWRINDEASTKLIAQFYEQLVKAGETNISKAEALRRAQLSILKNPDYQSPHYWAAYVLLGNWT